MKCRESICFCIQGNSGKSRITFFVAPRFGLYAWRDYEVRSGEGQFGEVGNHVLCSSTDWVARMDRAGGGE
jgi:hypothetical protein